MSYFIRLFTPEKIPTLVPVQAQLMRYGFQVRPIATNQVDIFYHPAQPPFAIDLTDSNSPTTRQDIMAFIQAVSRLDADPPTQTLVLDVLARTRALLAVGVPDGFSRQFDAALDLLLEHISDVAEGLFQVDGQGFYDGDTLILKL